MGIRTAAVLFGTAPSVDSPEVEYRITTWPTLIFVPASARVDEFDFDESFADGRQFEIHAIAYADGERVFEEDCSPIRRGRRGFRP